MTNYVDAALAGELDELRAATSGNRNATLFRTAARLYQFVEAGVIERNDVHTQLAQAALAIGLPPREVQATLRSAERRARGHAARVPHAAVAATPVAEPPLVDLAPEESEPPCLQWQAAADGLCDWAPRRLWHPDNRHVLAWLEGRGLTKQTIVRAGLGYNPNDRYDDRATWGLPPIYDDGSRAKPVWLPRGVVIPWFVGGRIWRVFIRRPLSKAQIAAGEPTYVQIPGGTNALYNADRLCAGQAAMLVEGAFDALLVQQEAGDLVAAVASGTTGARRIRWIAALAQCQPVLLSFDADAAGEEATRYWHEVLGEVSRVWRPYLDDPATMLQQGMELRRWVELGLEQAFDNLAE
jgi:DNA primase